MVAIRIKKIAQTGNIDVACKDVRHQKVQYRSFYSDLVHVAFKEESLHANNCTKNTSKHIQLQTLYYIKCKKIHLRIPIHIFIFQYIAAFKFMSLN